MKDFIVAIGVVLVSLVLLAFRPLVVLIAAFVLMAVAVIYEFYKYKRHEKS